MIALLLAAILPLLDEPSLKTIYTGTSIYTMYNTNSVSRCTRTQDPLAAMIGLGEYYGRIPLGARKFGKAEPASTLKERAKVFNKFVRAAGFNDDTFDKFPKWKSRANAFLKFKDMNHDCVEVADAAALEKHIPAIKKSLEAKAPVLWVRESDLGYEGEIITDSTGKTVNGGKPFPLTLALIDGLDDDGKLHVVWPKGWDRRYKDVKSGYHAASELFREVTRTALLFWRP